MIEFSICSLAYLNSLTFPLSVLTDLMSSPQPETHTLLYKLNNVEEIVALSNCHSYRAETQRLVVYLYCAVITKSIAK